MRLRKSQALWSWTHEKKLQLSDRKWTGSDEIEKCHLSVVWMLHERRRGLVRDFYLFSIKIIIEK